MAAAREGEGRRRLPWVQLVSLELRSKTMARAYRIVAGRWLAAFHGDA